MEFHGFTPQTGEFFWELSFNNERPWFLAHKERFEEVVNRPFKALSAETLRLMRERFPERRFDAHNSRIYRDARRLFGRGPYKDNLWFVIYQEEQRNLGPAFWFEIGRRGCSAGMGFWDASPAMMDVFRRQIDANPARFERVLDEIGPDWSLWGEPYKRPKGERGARINPWYNRRAVSAAKEWDLGGPEAKENLPEKLTALFARLMPLFDFCYEAWQAGRQV